MSVLINSSTSVKASQFALSTKFLPLKGMRTPSILLLRLLSREIWCRPFLRSSPRSSTIALHAQTQTIRWGGSAHRLYDVSPINLHVFSVFGTRGCYYSLGKAVNNSIEIVPILSKPKYVSDTAPEEWWNVDMLISWTMMGTRSSQRSFNTSRIWAKMSVSLIIHL